MLNDFSTLAEQYKNELLNSVIPFWEKFSVDSEHGGYFTCLGRAGEVYDTDKFVWLQGRQVWMFSTLYNNVEKNSDWLKTARHGAEFLEKYGRDSNGDWYFSLNREGKPLIVPYNIFSDCFAAMAFGQLAKATGNDHYSQIAVKTFRNILARENNPKGVYSKTISGTRPLKGVSLPMILCNLSLEIEHHLDRSFVHETIDRCIHEVTEVFYDKATGLIRENVNTDGSFSDSFEGRLLNPGHGIEAMWFIMDLAVRNSNRDLLEKAVRITLDILNYSWDNEYGGIYYFMDIMGKPVQQLEWDQKLWWVHIETLVNLVKAYYLTRNPECLTWFKTLHEYTWSHFPDPAHGEWFGYLNRRGEVLLPLKGGKWKGCFHVPRGLYQVWRILEKLSEEQTG